MIWAGGHVKLSHRFEIPVATATMQAGVIQTDDRHHLLCQLLFCAPL